MNMRCTDWANVVNVSESPQPPRLEPVVIYQGFIKQAFHKTEMFMTGVICAAQMPLIGLTFVNFSDALHLIKAKEDSHYVSSEVSLTYGNAHISYGFNIPCIWIFPEEFWSFFFTFSFMFLVEIQKKLCVWSFLLILLKSFSYVLNLAPQQQTTIQLIHCLMLSSGMD